MKLVKNKKFKIAAFLLVVFALVLIFVQSGEKPSDYLSKVGNGENTLYSQSEKNKSNKDEVEENESVDENDFEEFDISSEEDKNDNYDDYASWIDENSEYEDNGEKYYPYEGDTWDFVASTDASDDDESQSQSDNNVPEGNYCFLSVRCDALLNNMSRLEKSKRSFVPSDGIIYPKRAVTFNDGESVFDVLQREMRENKIHLEFVNTPVYNSVYVEGIANLYEFDCGSGSGWIYRVNGNVPGYGCSNYKLSVGDMVEFLYTCNLGKDIE